MAHRSRARGRGTWSAVAVLAAALAGPAAAPLPVTATAVTTLPVTTTAVTAPAPTPPPLPLPVPTPGQGLRERAEQAKHRLDTRGDVPDVLAAWGLDPGSGKLAVDVLGPDAAVASAFLLTAGIDPTTVVMRTDAPRNRLYEDLVGGDAIYSGTARCSLGFTARNGSGQRFVITAGHCTRGRTDWSGYNRTPIGPTRGSNFPRDDFGAIAVTNSAWKATAKVKGGPNVRGSSVAGVGSKVCRSGSTTGYRCGVIQAVDQTVNYGGGDVVTGLTKTNVCAEPGDSGGTFITPAGQGQGVTSGGSGNCRTGGTTYFQPLKEILKAYGLSLVTG